MKFRRKLTVAASYILLSLLLFNQVTADDAGDVAAIEQVAQ